VDVLAVLISVLLAAISGGGLIWLGYRWGKQGSEQEREEEAK
jgi:hypothetical protein